MKVLVVGSGGREHALAWKLAQESEVYCSPGNPGIAEDCGTFDVPASDPAGLIRLISHVHFDLVVIGPEDPLIAGLADALRAAGAAILGPGQDGARHEASKVWSKDMMAKAGVPTAAARTFTDSKLAKEYARGVFDQGAQVVVKASGAALGKGVVVCSTLQEAVDALAMMMDAGGLGAAGQNVVVEERLTGREFSLLTLVGGTSFSSLPVAQDYKRIFDNDEGPNTGGMGSASPVPWVSHDLVRQAEDKIVRPMIDEMARQGIDYRGVLFSGVMVVDGVPKCLEYNVRFGDPETQSVMMRIGSGLADALFVAANGGPVPSFQVADNAAVSVVVASEGYPGSYPKGVPIEIDPLPPGVKVFHAGTGAAGGQVVTNGGRVLAVTASASTVLDARKLAYEGVGRVRFEGMQFRSDIAAPILEP